MKTTRAQWLGLLGVVGSLAWLSLNTLFSPEFGYPGTANYLGYQTISRLWAPAFALILCGYLGLYRRFSLLSLRRGRLGFGLISVGLVLMMAGNVAEFWFFMEQAYGFFCYPWKCAGWCIEEQDWSALGIRCFNDLPCFMG